MWSLAEKETTQVAVLSEHGCDTFGLGLFPAAPVGSALHVLHITIPFTTLTLGVG